jgi:hypothetical protein
MHGNEAWRRTDSIESMLLEHSIQTNTKKNIKIIDISLIVLSIKLKDQGLRSEIFSSTTFVRKTTNRIIVSKISSVLIGLDV